MTASEDAGETLTLRAPVDASSSFRHWAETLRTWLPDCSVVEVGSTGIPGLPSKGDLDIAVVADTATAWTEAVKGIRHHLEPHEPQHWSATWASFRGAGAAGEVGVQVVVAGGEEDGYLRGFRALLQRDASVVARYAALKESHDGRSMQDYRMAKGRFVQDELGVPRST